MSDPPDRFERINAALNPDHGFKETELGELRSTISKLTKEGTIDRLVAKAVHDIQTREDRKVFADMAQAILSFQNERMRDGR